MPLTEEQEQYLREHQLAVLGTGRRDGSPQLSQVNYVYDGQHLYISTSSDGAMW